MSWSVFILAGLILVTLLVWRWSRRLQRQTGLPDGDVIYTDTGAWIPNDQPLFADDLRLVGKPDYLVKQANGAMIPVEIKSRRAPAEPYDGHVLQLAAYCLLVEVNYGVRPAYGILQYRDQAFAIDYTETLEDDLLDTLAEMRADLYADDVDRDHNDWRRCAKCSLNQDCYQRLA
jgi:CRISPR-associated exonuclease Cas4